MFLLHRPCLLSCMLCLQELEAGVLGRQCGFPAKLSAPVFQLRKGGLRLVHLSGRDSDALRRGMIPVPKRRRHLDPHHEGFDKEGIG